MAKRRKWTRKQKEGWRRNYVGDLRHMLRCCKRGRLHEEHAEYLAAILRDERHLPQPQEVAERVQLTAEQREQNHLYRIPPVDLTNAQLKERKLARDRERKRLARRRAGQISREEYLAQVKVKEPGWIKAGVSERTWYRNKAKKRHTEESETGPSAPHKPNGRGFVRTPQNEMAGGSSAYNKTIPGHTYCHSSSAAPICVENDRKTRTCLTPSDNAERPLGLQAGNGCAGSSI